MNVLLIGFRYFEIESLQDKLLGVFPEMKVDFAISVRDSWYRLKIASYDLIILDATSSEMESLVTYQEVVSRGEGIPVILLVSNEELQYLAKLNGERPRFLLNKDEGFSEKIIMMLQQNETKKEKFHSPELKKETSSTWHYFQAAMNISDTPMILLNRKLEIVEANNSFFNEYQFQKEEVVGNLYFHVLSEYKETCEESNTLSMITNLFNSDFRGENISSEYNTFQPKGIIKNAAPVRNLKGEVEHVILSLKPKARHDAKENTSPFDKNLLEVLLNGLSDGLLFCDSDNKVILMNQTAEDLLSLPQDDVIGKTVFDLPVGEGENWLVEVLRTQKSQMRFNSFAFKTRLNNNNVQIRFAPVYGPEKNYLGGFLYMTEVEDVSKVKEKEQYKILDKNIINIDKIITPNVIAEG